MSNISLSQPRLRRFRGSNRVLSGLGLAASLAVIGLPTVTYGQPITDGLYTDQSGRRFSNITPWNFTQGYSGTNPIPFSGAATSLIFGGYGDINGYAPSNDLNLTLNQIRLNYFSKNNNTNVGVNLSSSLGGTYTFANNGATLPSIQINGSGGSTGSGNVGATMSAGFVLSSLATGLNVNAAGSTNGVAALNTNFSGTITSNLFNLAATSNGINVNTNSLPNTGSLIFTGGNTFSGGGTLGANNAWSGGVTLTSGNLILANAGGAGGLGLFGNTYNTLTIASGSTGTLAGAVAFINPVVLADSTANLVITGGRGNENTALTIGGYLANGVSGAGGVVVRPAGSGQVQNFQGINTYSGATTIGQIQYATNGTPGSPGIMRLQGAYGQLANTSAININDGGTLEINRSGGDSVNTTRVSSAPISAISGNINVIGSGGFTSTTLGTLTEAGQTTIALALGKVNGAASASTAVTVPNLVRSAGGTFVFSGAGLGNGTAAVGNSFANINLGAINGAAPSAALVGGG
ncbi:MAG TPA: hypothetical protein VH120_08775, partial [Gemmataceae bacterium]|nr:hypothetical protein [Gemmataceae bacterium]